MFWVCIINVLCKFGDRQDTRQNITDTLDGVAIYINRDQATERKANAIKQLNKIGFKQILREPGPDTPGFGIFGCAQGHMNALKTLSRSHDVSWGLIVEDDVEIFKPDVVYKFIKNISNITNKYPLIKLVSYDQMKSINYGATEFENVYFANGHMTSQVAYIVRQTYANFLSDYIKYSIPGMVAEFARPKRLHVNWVYEVDVVLAKIQVEHSHTWWYMNNGFDFINIRDGNKPGFESSNSYEPKTSKEKNELIIKYTR